ncbi:hypothetical protein ALQ47_05248 [Pseudomonas cichorii]|nr:hypothetical protein ALQ47_05248 [Pseudomonas cichorii]
MPEGLQVGNLTGEFGTGHALAGPWPQGVADGAGGLAGQACQNLPLVGHAQSFETGMALAGSAQDVRLQALDQGLMAAAAAYKIGTGAQMLGQLTSASCNRRLQRAFAQPCMPERQAEQQCKCHQRQREVAQQQARQIVMSGFQDHGHRAVLSEIPQQPGVVVAGDGAVFPQIGIRHHRDQPLAVDHLHHVRGIGAVGPGLGMIQRVFQVEGRVEAHVGRFFFVFQIQARQFGPAHRRFAGSGRDQWNRRLGQRIVFQSFFFAILQLDVPGEVLANLDPVQQQVAAAVLLLIPYLLGDEQQVAAGSGPAQQPFGLGRCHVFATVEQQERLWLLTDVGKLEQVTGGVDRGRTLTQEVFGSQIRIGRNFRRRSLVDDFFIGLKMLVGIATAQQQCHEHQQADQYLLAPAHRFASASNSRRQPSQSSCCRCAGGRRWP